MIMNLRIIYRKLSHVSISRFDNDDKLLSSKTNDNHSLDDSSISKMNQSLLKGYKKRGFNIFPVFLKKNK
jgi:hypothetical protein